MASPLYMPTEHDTAVRKDAHRPSWLYHILVDSADERLHILLVYDMSCDKYVNHI